MHRRRRSTLKAVGIAIGATLAYQALAAQPGIAAAAGTRSCAAAAQGRAEVLLERVPVVMSVQMAAARGGGALLAFSSYRGARGFPASRFTVLALDASGCIRWRASLRGHFLARPIQPDARTVVVASGTISGEPLHIYSLSATSGRVLHDDLFAKLNAVGTTLLGDGRGSVAAVLADANGPATLKLTRRAPATRWTRQVLAHVNGQAPAAFARPDGRMVVGYPRSGRFEVRTGAVGGSLGPAVSAGPMVGNFRSAAVALGPDATVAAVWQTATYGRPWRLRAAVRPAAASRFGRFEQLGFADNPRGTLLLSEVRPGVRVNARGRVTLGFVGSGPGPSGKALWCARASRAGRFASPRLVGGAGEVAFDVDAMAFGSGAAGSVLGSADAAARTVFSLDPACRSRGAAPLDSALGIAAQYMVDARGRTWVVGQDRSLGGIDSRPDLRLQIVTPPR